MQAGQEFVVERHPHPFVGEPEVLREELQCLHFVVKFDLLDGIRPMPVAGGMDERLARSDDVLLFRCQVLKPLEVAVLVVELGDIREADATEFLEEVFSGEFELREELGLLPTNWSRNWLLLVSVGFNFDLAAPTRDRVFLGGSAQKNGSFETSNPFGSGREGSGRSEGVRSYLGEKSSCSETTP